MMENGGGREGGWGVPGGGRKARKGRGVGEGWKYQYKPTHPHPYAPALRPCPLST